MHMGKVKNFNFPMDVESNSQFYNFKSDKMTAKLNDDQLRVIKSLKELSSYISGSDKGYKGLPYKEIMKSSG